MVRIGFLTNQNFYQKLERLSKAITEYNIHFASTLTPEKLKFLSNLSAKIEKADIDDTNMDKKTKTLRRNEYMKILETMLDNEQESAEFKLKRIRQDNLVQDIDDRELLFLIKSEEIKKKVNVMLQQVQKAIKLLTDEKNYWEAQGNQEQLARIADELRKYNNYRLKLNGLRLHKIENLDIDKVERVFQLMQSNRDEAPDPSQERYFVDLYPESPEVLNAKRDEVSAALSIVEEDLYKAITDFNTLKVISEIEDGLFGFIQIVVPEGITPKSPQFLNHLPKNFGTVWYTSLEGVNFQHEEFESDYFSGEGYYDVFLNKERLDNENKRNSLQEELKKIEEELSYIQDKQAPEVQQKLKKLNDRRTELNIAIKNIPVYTQSESIEEEGNHIPENTNSYIVKARIPNDSIDWRKMERDYRRTQTAFNEIFVRPNAFVYIIEMYNAYSDSELYKVKIKEKQVRANKMLELIRTASDITSLCMK